MTPRIFEWKRSLNGSGKFFFIIIIIIIILIILIILILILLLIIIINSNLLFSFGIFKTFGIFLDTKSKQYQGGFSLFQNFGRPDYQTS